MSFDLNKGITEINKAIETNKNNILKPRDTIINPPINGPNILHTELKIATKPTSSPLFLALLNLAKSV